MAAEPSTLDLLRHEIRALPFTRKALRQFGWLVGGVLLGLTALIAWRRGWTLPPLLLGLGGVGAALVLLGTIAPGVLGPAYRVWMTGAVVLGFFVSRVLLALLFAVAFVPMAFVMRLAGRDAMQRRPDPGASSYWIARDPTPTTRERLERYF